MTPTPQNQPTVAIPPRAEGNLESDGETLGRYVDVRLIGRGGMGAILRGRDPAIGRPVAIKVLLTGAQAPPEEVARFLREAQVTGQLVHPNIPPIHEIGRTQDGRQYFVMKLIEGRSLADRIDELGPDGGEAARRAMLSDLLKVCDALGYAHSRGVVHRDLKPANIMIGEFGEVLLMDWGIAKVLEEVDPSTRPDSAAVRSDTDVSRTSHGSILGTPYYMAPEQASGRVDEVGPRSDIYSLGALLFEILTHSPPRPAGSDDSGPDRPHPLPSERAARKGIGRELDAIVATAMAWEPASRYETVGGFRQDLDSYLNGYPVSVVSYPPWAPAFKWAARNRAITAISSLAIVAVSILVAWLVQESRRASASAAAAISAHEALARESERDGAYAELLRLRRATDAIWPIDPDRVPEMEEWLGQARALAGRTEHHREVLARMVSDAPESAADRWALDQQRDLVAGLEELATRSIPEMTERLRRAHALEETMAAARAEWQEVIVSVGDPSGGGIELGPQLGLVPIGRDPDSRLWEFWHVLSGERPERGPDGRLESTERSGIVLVLLPGGTFLMGSPDINRGFPGERPARTVTLRPFFLAKYEMTQGQWERATGSRPSQFGPDTGTLPGIFTLDHPVENVSWSEVDEALTRLGLRLPSEARWEYAARAGTATTWYTGNARASIEGHANVADASFQRSYGAGGSEAWDDAYIVHSPVGIFRANRFGLHDVIGNVWEWCSDTHQPDYEGAPSDGSPWIVPGNDLRSYRGGSYGHNAVFGRSACRSGARPEYRTYDIGVRPARDIEPD